MHTFVENMSQVMIIWWFMMAFDGNEDFCVYVSVMQDVYDKQQYIECKKRKNPKKDVHLFYVKIIAVFVFSEQSVYRQQNDGWYII